MALFGPVAANSSEAMTSGGHFAWGFALFCVVSGYFIYTETQHVLRARSLKREAIQRGWAWTGESLPNDLPVREFYGKIRKVQISNAFQGRKGVVDFVGFDCAVGEGRSRAQFSMVGARSATNCFGAEKFDSNLEIVQLDDWCMIRRTIQGIEMHRPGFFFMSAKEMISFIESIG